MVLRWVTVAVLLLVTLWLVNSTVGLMWAAGFVARPDFDPQPYLVQACWFLILTGVSFISLVGMTIHAWRYQRRSNKK
jgi:hypothetical protein